MLLPAMLAGCTLMLDIEARRSRIKMIVAANKEVDSSKREESKIRRDKTRRAIVAISTRIIELSSELLFSPDSLLYQAIICGKYDSRSTFYR
jgi:hypothetical protein